MVKPKITKKKLSILIISATVLLAVIVAALLLLNNPFSDNLKKAIGIKSDAPTFVFNEQTAGSWWAAANYNAKENVTNDYKGDQPKDKLSIASRNIFQSRNTTVDSCFVMYAYYDYPGDIDALLKSRVAVGDASGLIYNELPSQTLAIDTMEGTKPYQLHEYSITGPGSEKMQRGMSYGYVKLSHGYISINGVCPEGSQLNGTVSAMKSISLIK